MRICLLYFSMIVAMAYLALCAYAVAVTGSTNGLPAIGEAVGVIATCALFLRR